MNELDSCKLHKDQIYGRPGKRFCCNCAVGDCDAYGCIQGIGCECGLTH